MRVRKNEDEEDIEVGFLEQFATRGVTITEQKAVSTAYRIWLDEQIKEPQYYRRALEVLETAGEDDYVFIHVDTTGGHVGTAVKLINAIRNSSATVMGVLEHRAYSAGSMILLACPRIMVKPYATLMAHSVSVGAGGDLQKLMDYGNFLKKETDRLIEDVYTGFLSPSEIEAVKLGSSEIWLTDSEILDRLDTLAEYKKLQREAELENQKIAEAAEKPKAVRKRKPKTAVE